jgi:uncharacterized repeat protein (TIGR01451 family)
MLVLMVFIGLCAVLTASSVSAASTVYVNATGGSDSNIGTIDHPYQTIYQGINSVEENGTVKIADGTYTGTGNTNITINKNVTITGQSQEGTIINGTDTNWIFHINPGFTVTIQNLTITNGKSIYGGAIYNSGTSTVVDSTFIGNTVNMYGGAIYNNNAGILTVAGCTFTNNRAEAGGAIFNWATIHDVTGCAFTGNTALIAGGAICNVGGTTNNVTNCTFTNNTVTGTVYGGGALYSYGEGSGGSIKNVTGCTFTDNKASLGGGAIHNDIGSSMVIHFNSFVGNTANFSSAINNTGNSVDATDNWWGSNNPVWTNLISGMPNPINWLYMTINATATTINITQTSLVTVSFNNIYNGTTVTSFDPITGHIPDGTFVNLTSTLGSFNPTATTTVNGIVTSLFTANHAGTGNLNAITDNQTVTQLLAVHPISYMYLNTTTSKKNPAVGETFIVTYKLSNKGPDNATNVTVSFQIPVGLEFVNASVDNGTWTYNPANRTITWTLSNVAVGDPYLYLSVRALGSGSYTITPTITSETFNQNNDPLTSFTVNVQSQNNSNSNTVNAASTTKTVPMQTTGMPIAGLVLAILAVLGGIFTPRKK